MVSRKITNDNCVRHVRKSEQTRESKPNVIKKSIPRKQNEQTQSISKGGKKNTRKKNNSDEKFSKNDKKILKDFAAGGFGILTK